MPDQIASNSAAGKTAHRVDRLNARVARLEFRISRAENGADGGFDVAAAKEELEERRAELAFLEKRLKRQTA